MDSVELLTWIIGTSLIVVITSVLTFICLLFSEHSVIIQSRNNGIINPNDPSQRQKSELCVAVRLSARIPVLGRKINNVQLELFKSGDTSTRTCSHLMCKRGGWSKALIVNMVHDALLQCVLQGDNHAGICLPG